MNSTRVKRTFSRDVFAIDRGKLRAEWLQRQDTRTSMNSACVKRKFSRDVFATDWGKLRARRDERYTSHSYRFPESKYLYIFKSQISIRKSN